MIHTHRCSYAGMYPYVSLPLDGSPVACFRPLACAGIPAGCRLFAETVLDSAGKIPAFYVAVFFRLLWLAQKGHCHVSQGTEHEALTPLASFQISARVAQLSG